MKGISTTANNKKRGEDSVVVLLTCSFPWAQYFEYFMLNGHGPSGRYGAQKFGSS